MSFKHLLVLSFLNIILIHQFVLADVKTDLANKKYSDKNLANQRRLLTNRVEEDIQRVQQRKDTLMGTRSASGGSSYYPDSSYTPKFKIDTKDKNLTAKVFSRKSNDKKGLKAEENKLTQAEKDSIATELNIDFRRAELQKLNDGK